MPGNILSEPDVGSLHRGNNLRRAGVFIGTSLALLAASSHIARAETTSVKSSNEKAVPTRLRDPHELPGLKLHLGQETLNKLKNSTLEIVQRRKVEFGGLPDDQWGPGCTAVKVVVPPYKEPQIMTSAHCFRDLTGVVSGIVFDINRPQYAAENFVDMSPNEYAVVDPNADYPQRLDSPIARIDAISISTYGKDTAMLHPVAIPPSTETLPSVRNFDSIPSIPLKVADNAPKQGTPVALYGEPQATNFEPIMGTGVFLGRVWSEVDDIKSDRSKSKIIRPLDVVGINPAYGFKDNCNYATSGSMALLQNGQLLGNLSVRLNRGYYGPEAVQQVADQASAEYIAATRADWERQLGVSFKDFVVVCGYTVMDASTPQDLLGGYKIAATNHK